jgi:hypothetical protein
MSKDSIARKCLHALQKLSIKEGDIIVVSDYEVMGVLTSQPMPGIPSVPVIYSEGGVDGLSLVDIKTLRDSLAAAERLEQERLRAAADTPLPPAPKPEIVQ